MNVDWINGATQKELDQFKSVCNQLLSRTYLVKTLCRADKVRINNPDYLFLSSHYAEVREYLALLDWDLRKDDFNGYFYAILLAIRMIYDENQERLGVEHDAICTVRDLLEKVVTDYAILSARPNMKDVKRALTLLDNHCVIQRIEGKYSQGNCKFAILPTVLSVVSSEKLDAVVSVLRKEEDSEEAEEDSAD